MTLAHPPCGKGFVATTTLGLELDDAEDRGEDRLGSTGNGGSWLEAVLELELEELLELDDAALEHRDEGASMESHESVSWSAGANNTHTS